MMHQRTIGDILTDITLHAEQREGITLRQCIALLEQRSIELLILFFSLLNSIPIPSIPGLSTITGLPIILLGAQMVLGFDAILLPERIQSCELHHGRLSKALHRILPTLHRMERVLRPRILWISDAPYTRLWGVVFIALATLLALPIPFFNCPSGIAMSLLAIGLITRDGLLVLVGLTSAAFILVVFVLLSDQIIAGVIALFAALF